MPALHESRPRQFPGCLLPVFFARLCVACLATSGTSLPLCRYHGFRYQRLIADAFINAKIIQVATRTLWGVSRTFQRWLKPTSRCRS
jgi:hypothetical protein